MIALGSDHGGFALKQAVIQHLESQNIPYQDYGCFDTNAVDYPDIAHKVAYTVSSKKHEKALLFCGTGIGISMAANKVSGIRAAVCSDCFSAKYTRLHNDANILCLGGRVVGVGLAIEIVDIFLSTPFEGGRHQNRIDLIEKI